VARETYSPPLLFSILIWLAKKTCEAISLKERPCWEQAGREGKRKLTESSKEFPKASALPTCAQPLRKCGSLAFFSPASYFFCGSNNFSPFLNTA
jgi:hypothetical protein